MSTISEGKSSDTRLENPRQWYVARWLWFLLLLIGFWFANTAFGWQLAFALVLVFALDVALWRLLRRAYVHVAEKETAVVYDLSKRAFSRFLPPGRHWLLPGIEVVQAVMSTRPQAATGSCAAHFAGGIPVHVGWKTTFALSPHSIAPDLRANMAATLVKNPVSLVETHLPNIIRHTLAACSVDQIFAPGALSHLENRLRSRLRERLDKFGFVLHNVLVEDLQVSAAVRQAVEAAYITRLQAQTETLTLGARRAALRAYSAQEFEWMVQLERLRVLGTRPGDTHVIMEEGTTPIPVNDDAYQARNWLAPDAAEVGIE